MATTHRNLARLAASVLLMAAATTAPVPRPSAAPADDPAIARSFAQLADADPAVRDAARERLMGLSADALPALCSVAKGARPLRPDQAGVLHEIVTQVFLSADPYATAQGEPTRWIMGQNWPRWFSGGERVGAPVVNRWPGFPSRRVLRDGDLILGLYTDPNAAADRPPDVPTPAVSDLVEGMRNLPTLPRMTFAVLRDGRTLRLTVALVAEPLETVNRIPAATAAFLGDRQRRADDYWQDHFAPVVSPPDPIGE